MRKGVQKAQKVTLALSLALCIALCGQSARTAFAGEIAFVDVVRVISESTPGKEAQKIVDDLRDELNTRFETYSKSEPDEQKVVQRQIELNRTYAAEHARVVALVRERLLAVVNKWLSGNNKGVTSVVASSSALAVAASDDITQEVLTLLNQEKIDFAAK